MSAAAARAPRPILEILLNAAGLAVWAAHFGAVYGVHALACERTWAGGTLLGLPFVPAAIGGLTLLALLALVLIYRAARRRMPVGPRSEGGEAEPRFTAWFAAATAAYSALAVVFQAAPALLVPGCG
jgi:hypothetical protein